MKEEQKEITKEKADEYYKKLLESVETTELSKSSKRIAVELKKLNNPELSILIDEIEQGKFDDFHVNAYPLPIMELVDRLYALGLHDMAKKIIRGEK